MQIVFLPKSWLKKKKWISFKLFSNNVWLNVLYGHITDIVSLNYCCYYLGHYRIVIKKVYNEND